ncbi:MAG: dihydroorotate dehydrogenase [Chloroflexi bacterium]|nr:dihydroorotate dehydrogenase [Chloroflexota bacterium]
MPDVAVDLCGVRLCNPLVLASGIWGSCAETLIRVARAGAGAVTAKSCSVAPRLGHPNPTVLAWEHGLINAVGLSNPGAAVVRDMARQAKGDLAALGVPLILSVFGGSPREFTEAAATLAEAEPDFLELNISCPNVEDEFGLPFALDPRAAAEVTASVRRVWGGRLLVKLSPNAPNLVEVARAAVEAGADGLTAVNTLGPGMLLDVRARRPILSNRVGGLSGGALHPIAVRCVYEVSQAVKVPIIGTGGVSSGEDVLRMIMAGATAVGIGSALYEEGEAIFGRILREMEEIMQDEGIATLDAIRGCAHA